MLANPFPSQAMAATTAGVLPCGFGRTLFFFCSLVASIGMVDHPAPLGTWPAIRCANALSTAPPMRTLPLVTTCSDNTHNAAWHPAGSRASL